MTRAARHTTLQKRCVGVPSSAQQPNKNPLCNTPTTFCRYSNYMGEATNEAVGDGLLYAQTAVTLLRATHHMVYTLRRETKLRRSALCAAALEAKIPSQHRNSVLYLQTQQAPLLPCRNNLWCNANLVITVFNLLPTLKISRKLI